MIPNGLAEIRKVYGDPRPFMRDDGRIMAAWERAILAPVTLPAPLLLGWDRTVTVRRISVHRVLAEQVSAIFTRIHKNGWWPLIESYDGCYAWRAKRSGSRLSVHAWAAAIDLNAESNPMGSGRGDMPSEIIAAFISCGWEWGGDWSDPMHFQAATGY